MQTQCPSCRSVFRVSHQQLSVAAGMVRCGKCGVVFNGNDNIKRLRTRSPLTPPSHASRHEAPSTPAAQAMPEAPAHQARTRSDNPQHATAPDRAAAAAARAKFQWEQPSHPPMPLYPEPMLEATPRSRASWRLGVVGVLALLVAAGAWSVYQERARFYDYPGLATWAAKACAYVGCEVPPRRDVDRIEIVERDVYSRPEHPNTLTIAATLVNKAQFPQPYPLMQVSFSNLQGAVVASRRFEPGEYLATAPTARALMPPGVPIKVKAQIADPGETASAFEFAFF